MFPGTDHMTAVPLVNRSVDSDVIATRTNRTQIDLFCCCGNQTYTGYTQKKPSERVPN